MKKEQETKVEEKVSYPHEALQRIENEREIFWKSYKKHNLIKTIVLVVCMALIVAAWVVVPKIIPDNSNLSLGVIIGIGVVALGGSYAYSMYVRKKFDKKMKEYFELYFKSCNDYVYGEKPYSEVELKNPGKINLDEFNECKLYKDVIEAGSRGLTTFKYNNLEMSIVDCAGNVKAEKRIKPVFVGKMLRAKASYDGDIPVFVYLKGNDRALPPTNMEGIENVLEDQQMVVYSNYKDWKKVINGSVLKALQAVKTDKILVDVAFAIYSGKVFVMMGYDDPLMILPLQQTFDYKPTESYKKDMTFVCKVVEALNK